MTTNAALMKNGFPQMQGGKPIFYPCPSCCKNTTGTYSWPKTGFIVGSPCAGGGVWPYNPKVIISADYIKGYFGYSNGNLPASCVTGSLYDSSTNTPYCYVFNYNGTNLQLTQQELSSGTYVQPQAVSNPYNAAPDCCDCWGGNKCLKDGLGVSPGAPLQAALAQYTSQWGLTATVDLPTRASGNPTNPLEWHICCGNWITTNPNFGSMGTATSSGTVTTSFHTAITGADYPNNGHEYTDTTYSWGGTVSGNNTVIHVTVTTTYELLKENMSAPYGYTATNTVNVGTFGRCTPWVMRDPSLYVAPAFGIFVGYIPFSSAEGASGTSYYGLNSASFSASQQYVVHSTTGGGTQTHTNSASGNETISINSPAICGGCGTAGKTVPPIDDIPVGSGVGKLL